MRRIDHIKTPFKRKIKIIKISRSISKIITITLNSRRMLNAMVAISLVILLEIVETVILIMQTPVMPLMLIKILREILKSSLNKVKLL
jgi:hypothetical protein